MSLTFLHIDMGGFIREREQIRLVSAVEFSMPNSFEYPVALGYVKPEWDSMLYYVCARLKDCMLHYVTHAHDNLNCDDRRAYFQSFKREVVSAP